MNFVRLAAAACLCTLCGCGFGPNPGVADVPSIPAFAPGAYNDINPRWSHDGRQIAFLRATPDRRLQLCLTGSDLERTTALLEAEVVAPDREYDPRTARYSSPDTIAWSPNDRRIAFERAEWFQFEDGQRLPGTGIWSFEVHSGRVEAIALHPKHYKDLYYWYHTPAWSPDGTYISFVAEGINGQHLLGMRCTGVDRPKEVGLHFDNYASSDWPAWRSMETAAARGHAATPQRDVLAYCRGLVRSPSIPQTAVSRSLSGVKQAKDCENWHWLDSRNDERPMTNDQ